MCIPIINQRLFKFFPCTVQILTSAIAVSQQLISISRNVGAAGHSFWFLLSACLLCMIHSHEGSMVKQWNVLCEQCHLSWDDDLWLIGRERKTVALGQYTDKNWIKIRWENVLCQTASPVQLFGTFFLIGAMQRGMVARMIFFTNLSQQEFTVTNAASVVVLARAKNVVGHMPILHRLFRAQDFFPTSNLGTGRLRWW